ncbi:MAG: GspE/PulE family protein [Phycisphaeraceae bacterium]
MKNTPPTNPGPPVRVGDLLVDHGVISAEQLGQALEYQRKSDGRKLLGDVLVELGLVTQGQVMEAVADSYGLPFARIDATMVDPSLTELLPIDYCQKQGVVPMFLVQGKLTVAVSDPANVFLPEEIGRMTGHQVQVVAATQDDIRDALTSLEQGGEDVFVIDEAEQSIDVDSLDVVEQHSIDVADLAASAGESPVIKLVNFIIFSAVRESASDIHIEPDEGKLRVRYRVDGGLYEKIAPPPSLLPALVSRIKIMASLDISERRVPQDGAITIRIDKRQVDLRVSTMPGKFGEKVVMRIVDQKNAVTNLDKLGFSDEMLTVLRDLISQPNGVVLVTGPTGSGKSTTLYGALAEINREDINISTVEDPVEYNLPGVNQFQTHDRAGFTFAKALRALLRQDPDVVMLGEIRDQETAKIATQAALTGHMVLSTLHTNDAPSAVTRLINIGVEPYLVAAALRGVLAQRLVRRVCSGCTEPLKPTDKDQRILEHLAKDGDTPTNLVQGTGCKKCRGTGFSGRLGLYEIFVPDAACMDAVSKGASLQEVRMLAEQGSTYITLKKDGVAKASAGLTTLQEVFKAVAL